MRPEVCADCPVRDDAVCSALRPDELAELAAIAHHKSFERGETIFAAGDDSIACATLISGAAKIVSADEDGVERIVALIHPAGFMGQLVTAASPFDVIALTDTRLCLFPRGGFERVMADHPKLIRSILERTQAELDASRTLTSLI
ncbi:MAG TPA: cyclic nucleotide-binding domain-containing protein, partial [Allosphingosinicella sp.]|nr:cyclic nucleotide-binding domain-containing protein [Allosphingosinicella sp.]